MLGEDDLRPRAPDPVAEPGSSTGRTLLFLLLIGLLAALPVGMFRTYRQAVRDLGRSLSHGTGMAVEAEDLWITPRPSLVLQRVRLRSAHLALTCDRLELVLDWRQVLSFWWGGTGTRRLVKGVRLLRPMLEISPRSLEFLEGRDTQASGNVQRREPGSSLATAGKGGGVELELEDGALKLSLDLGSQPLTLESKGIHFGTEQAPAGRLLVGRTTLLSRGKSLVDIPSAALDLSPGHGMLPVRLAAVGGRLDLLDRFPLEVHLLHVQRGVQGYRIQVKGAAGDGTQGQFVLGARLDAIHQPSSVRALSLQVSGLDMGLLGQLLTGAALAVSGSRLDGTLTLSREAAGLAVAVTAWASEVRIRHPVLAAAEVGPMPVELKAQAEISASGTRIRLGSSELRSGPIRLVLGGEVGLEAGAGVQLALDLALQAMPCQQLAEALPRGLAPALRGIYMRGDIGGVGRLRLHSADLDATDVGLTLEPQTCKVLVDPPAADVRGLRRGTFSMRLPDHGGVPSDARWLIGPENPDFVPITELGRTVRDAFVAAEDARFYRHQGFDGVQLRRAFVHNLRQGRIQRGASTISQQLVKNLFLSHRRTLSRKLQEAVITWRLEQQISKLRILELYLNMVEMGVNLRGVAQAARHYFDLAPDKLNPLQAAHLAAITPSPKNLTRMLDKSGRPSRRWMDRLHQILRQMKRNGWLSPQKAKRWTAARLRLEQGPD